MRYRDDLPDVIRDLSFDIRGGQKIGVVGRTGSGKSSLAQVRQANVTQLQNV